MADANQQMGVEDNRKGKRKAAEPDELPLGDRLPTREWTAQQVADWLSSSGYAGVKDALQGVNGEMLLDFSEEQLSKLGMLGVALYNKLHPAVEEAERGT